MKERGILFSAPMVRTLLAGTKTQTRRLVSPQPRQDGSAWLLPFPKKAGARVNHERIETFDKRTRVTTVVERTVPLEEWLLRFCPYGVPGEKLWVREAWRARLDRDHLKPSELDPKWDHPTYVADYPETTPSGCAGGVGRLRPGMFLPRWASRLTLEITEVRVQRLQEISEEDAIAEGAGSHGGNFPLVEERRASLYVHAFADLWNHINGKKAPWSSNPWVWALTFRRLP